MSRPRPPLHDPYGLLRPPPPLERPTSLYSATSTSTLSLPLSSSPNRRARQRGASPSRTQQGEEYDDQPYLTNVVRHHGQVTLVPPVNQGRTRKIRRRRNPDGVPGPSVSTTTLAEIGTRPTSAGGSSGRVDIESQPRRPRRGTDSRAVSSPDFGSSEPYPDYPPPSFEEVLALDRSAASPRVSVRPVGDERTPQAESSDLPPPAPPLAPPPVPLLTPSDSPNNPAGSAASTPWEEDRRLGLSLEQRVQRELERNLKHTHGREASPSRHSPTISVSPSIYEDAPPHPSPSTSIAASNFLTPQNLTPLQSPSRPQPELGATGTPRTVLEEQIDAPPVVPPKSPVAPLASTTPNTAASATEPPRADVIVPTDFTISRPPLTAVESQATADESLTTKPLERLALVFPSLGLVKDEREPIRATLQPASQGSPSTSNVSLSSLLFTTKLNLNGLPDSGLSQTTEPAGTGRASPRREHRDGFNGGRKAKEVNERSPERSSPVVPPSPRKVLSRLVPPERPSSPTRSSTPNAKPPPPLPSNVSLRPSIPPRPPSLRFPPPAPAPALVKANTEPPPPSSSIPSTKQDTEFPPAQRIVPDPPLSSALRRPPPPPPARRVGSAIAARISAYESILANAPKVPPPVPPRPRDRQAKKDTSDGGGIDVEPSGAGPSQALTERREEAGETRKARDSATLEEALKGDGIQEFGKVERTRETERSMQRQNDNASPTPRLERVRLRATSDHDHEPQPQSQPESGPSRIRARALSTSPRVPSPGCSRPRPETPEKAMAQAQAQALVQAQVLVPARIGPDGKLEIIPDAEVIWLDEAKERENIVERRSKSRDRAEPAGFRELGRGVFGESVAGPSYDPFSDGITPAFATSATNLVLPANVQHTLHPLITPQPAPPPITQRLSPSPIQQLSSRPVVGPPPVLAEPVLVAPEVNTPIATSPSHLADDFEYTDLDLLISRLEENETARQGTNYEQLLTVGEVLGPGVPPRPRPELDLNAGLIEIQRRRVMKDGRVKLKLSLMGVSVDKCGVCLTQFKNNENAVLLTCLHSFHTNCIMSWFVRQDVPACPHCRTPV